MRNLFKLNPQNHEVIAKIIAANNNETSKVDENYFEETVFKSVSNFVQLQKIISDLFTGVVSKELVETPLISERGNSSLLYTSTPDRGMRIGIIFIDYRKKNPLLVICLDKNESGYTYQSTRFENNQWNDGIDFAFDAETFNDFVINVSTKIREDVVYFTGKY
jgi:hypothetical protein